MPHDPLCDVNKYSDSASKKYRLTPCAASELNIAIPSFKDCADRPTKKSRCDAQVPQEHPPTLPRAHPPEVLATPP